MRNIFLILSLLIFSCDEEEKDKELTIVGGNLNKASGNLYFYINEPLNMSQDYWAREEHF